MPEYSPVLRRRLVIAGLAIAAFAADAFAPDAFSEMVPRPGESFYLVAAMLGGPWAGLIAAAASFARHWFVPNGNIEVFQALFALGEALFFGLASRSRQGLPRAAAVFWLLLGLPAHLFLPALSGMPNLPRGFAALAGVSIGLLSLMFARQVADFQPLARFAGTASPSSERPLRQSLLNTLFLATSAAAFFITLFQGNMQSRDAEEIFRQRVLAEGEAACQRLEDYIGSHARAVEALARSASHAPSPGAPANAIQLRATHAVYPGFLTMLISDAQARVVAVDPGITADGRDALSASTTLADRAYFQVPMRTGKPFVSPAFRGRGLGHHPIVALSSPIAGPASTPAGIVEGSLNLEALGKLQTGPAGSSRMAIFDNAGNVVYASPGLPFEVLSNASRTALFLAASQSPATPTHYSFARSEDHLVFLARCSTLGWQVLIDHSLAPVQQRLQSYRALTLAILLVVLLLSFHLADRVSRRFAQPLESLAFLVSSFDPGSEFLASRGSRLSGDSGSSEISTLIRQWNRLALRLRDTYASLRVAHEQTLAADRAKGRFLANMSHELRTPLNGVIGMTELLLSESLPAEQKDQVRSVRRSADSLLHTIDQILDISQLEEGRLELLNKPFSLPGLVESLASDWQAAAREKGLEADYGIDPNLPPTVLADEARLRQILFNLLDNSVKFTSTGHVSFSVLCDAGSVVWFEVQDTGQGIPRDAQPKLFQSFVQLDDSSSRQHGGAGLGLAVAKRLVELMGGEIGMHSEPGFGSTFWVRIPFQPAEVALTATPVASGAPLRVLVVEDNPVNQRITQRMLEKLGCAVDLAADGEQGVQAAAEFRYSVIFMDCQMPRMDGYQATAEIRRGVYSTVPIVAVTANALEGDRERCLAAGMDDYLAKPLQLTTLSNVLVRWSASQAPSLRN